MLTFLTISSLLIVLDGNRYPANLREMSQFPFMNEGYICNDGGILNTEFLSAAASLFDNFAARLSAPASRGRSISGAKSAAGAVAVTIAFLRDVRW
jgi:hypothetical protein